MGFKNLQDFLRKKNVLKEKIHVSKYERKKVGIDASLWMHAALHIQKKVKEKKDPIR